MKSALLLLTLLALPSWAAETTKPAGTLIDFRVDVQKSVPNDLGRASVYVEMTEKNASELAQKVKAALSESLAIAKAQHGITVKSGGTHTYPVYGKNSRTIESWRMRSELQLESRDAAALSSAVGKLQATLAVASINFLPAPETRRKAEDEAAIEAIDTFRSKADRIAATMKKPYRIKQMSVGSAGSYPPPMPMYRAAAMAADVAAPMPMPAEAGESNVTVNISGQIELLD